MVEKCRQAMQKLSIPTVNTAEVSFFYNYLNKLVIIKNCNFLVNKHDEKYQCFKISFINSKYE